MNNFDYKNMTPFKWFVLENFPFIENDFDAINNYHLFSKVVEYLNKTIDNMNLTGEQMENVTNAMTELQNYVNNYFNTLDVQDEINNKLDEMVESGTLYNIMLPYFSEINTLINLQNNRINELNDRINTISSINPIAVNNISEMTDTTKLYVNTTDGYWYFYNSLTNQWQRGGLYNSNGINEKQVTLDKIDFETILLNSYSILNKSIVNYNTNTFLPNFSAENENYLSVILEINENLNDIVIPLNNNLTGQIYVAYTENLKAQNLDRGYLNNHSYSPYYYYNSLTNELTLHLKHFYDNNYNNIAIQMSPSNYYIKILKNINCENTEFKVDKLISGNNIKDKTIEKNNIAFNLLDFDSTVNNVNYFDITNCEYKYSPNYNLPDRDINFVKNNNFLTIFIPNPHAGKIKIAKLFYPNISPLRTQIYGLNNEKLVVTNNVTSDIMSINQFPTQLSNGLYPIIYDDYIEIECNSINSNIEYIMLTFESQYLDDIYIYYINNYSPKWINNNKLLAKDIDVVLNKNFKVVKDMNLLFYPQNFTKYANIDNIPLIYLSNYAKYNLQNCIIVNRNSVAENLQTSLNYCLNNTKDISISKNINIQILDENSGNGLEKNVMLIGDSLTAYYGSAITQKLKSLFNNDVMNVNFIGTLNDAEGRSGWRAYTYCNCEHGYDDRTVTGVYQGLNPFFNPTTGVFDFSYYMNSQNFSSIDYVFINLGTNDITINNHNKENDILNYYNIMISSIKAYNPNVKIGLWLPPSKAIKNNTSNLLTRDKMLIMNEILINNFENRENENIFLIPVNVCLNPNLDYNTENIIINENEVYENITDYTHPKISGFEKMAEVIYFWIKYFASLN